MEWSILLRCGLFGFYPLEDVQIMVFELSLIRSAFWVGAFTDLFFDHFWLGVQSVGSTVSPIALYVD